ncbi:MAG: ribonuclease III [Planctomycetes bacterium RBG_13_46_10]|nr:MAG: ribonuclease III [Planctomycetes bacterium RBG_13_46_10]
MDKEILQQIEQIIGYQFSNKTLLAKTFAHSSAVDNRLSSNERLEFLGDSILGAVICQALFERFTDHLEGELTKLKSMLVSRETCAQVAKRLGLHKYLKVGKSMISNKALSRSIAAALLEAVIAAIYLDGGFDAASSFILRAYEPLIEQADKEQAQGNYKSLLQQYAQERYNTTPVYILLDEKGPDHDKCFESEVVIAERHFPSAWGTNKKEAEQKAAFKALIELGILKQNSQ